MSVGVGNRRRALLGAVACASSLAAAGPAFADEPPVSTATFADCAERERQLAL